MADGEDIIRAAESYVGGYVARRTRICRDRGEKEIRRPAV